MWREWYPTAVSLRIRNAIDWSQDGRELRELAALSLEGGAYELAGLPLGTIELSAASDHGSARQVFDLSAGADLTWDPLLDEGLVLSSRLVGEQGDPLVNVTVEVDAVEPIVGVRSFSSIVRTDAEGRFRVPGCPDEPLRIAVRETEGTFVGFSLEGVHARTVPDTIVVPDARRARCSVRGRILDVHGTPVIAKVRLESIATHRLLERNTDAQSGEFTFESLPPGSYLFEVTDSEGRLHEGRRIELAPGEQVDLATLQLAALGELSIDWSNAAGVDPNTLGWRVARSADGPGWSRNGRATEIEPVSLAAGRYIFKIYAPTVIHEAIAFEIAPAKQTVVQPKLVRGTQVTFRFSQSPGTAPVATARFEVLDARGDTIVDREIERHPKGLLFTSVQLPPGSYRMRAASRAMRCETPFEASLAQPHALIDVVLR